MEEGDPASGDARDNGGADVHTEEPAHGEVAAHVEAVASPTVHNATANTSAWSLIPTTGRQVHLNK